MKKKVKNQFNVRVTVIDNNNDKINGASHIKTNNAQARNARKLL